ncbi:MAG TPA: glycoside hydrolase 43 family protein [Tepidisphaeraceae bacterium]
MASAQSTSRPAQQTKAPPPGNRWGDQGDGTFINPVLPADYSDLDAIRVGDDYYAISSTLHVSPGMVVLHSRDLVNWRHLGHIVPDVSVIGPEMNWDRMNRYGRGVWAGAIRHHEGKFWVYFASPDEGIFVTTATDPAGPWEPLHLMWKVSGWNDLCPFWDDDGQGYLATTHFARDPATDKSYNIHLFKMGKDNKSLDHASDRIIHQSRGSEASKLYKIGGVYYHFYSEVRSEGRVVMMNRSRSLDGPWETKQLNHASRIDKNPNQGGLIELPSGEWWFVTHQGQGDWEGRAMCLLPVTWIEGWPIIGEPGADGIGNMVWQAKKPIDAGPPVYPATDDDFSKDKLGSQWEWNHQPRADKWSLTERPGFVRLHAVAQRKAGDFFKTPNVLSQRAWRTSGCTATAKLDLTGMADGQHVGMVHFARSFGSLGVVQAGGRKTIEYVVDGKATAGPEITATDLWLRSSWDGDGQCTFAYSTDGTTFTPFGETYKLSWGRYRGDRCGIYSYNNDGERGHVDVDVFTLDRFAGKK